MLAELQGNPITPHDTIIVESADFNQYELRPFLSSIGKTFVGSNIYLKDHSGFIYQHIPGRHFARIGHVSGEITDIHPNGTRILRERDTRTGAGAGGPEPQTQLANPTIGPGYQGPPPKGKSTHTLGRKDTETCVNIYIQKLGTPGGAKFRKMHDRFFLFSGTSIGGVTIPPLFLRPILAELFARSTSSSNAKMIGNVSSDLRLEGAEPDAKFESDTAGTAISGIHSGLLTKAKMQDHLTKVNSCYRRLILSILRHLQLATGGGLDWEMLKDYTILADGQDPEFVTNVLAHVFGYALRQGEKDLTYTLTPSEKRHISLLLIGISLSDMPDSLRKEVVPALFERDLWDLATTQLSEAEIQKVKDIKDGVGLSPSSGGFDTGASVSCGSTSIGSDTLESSSATRGRLWYERALKYKRVRTYVNTPVPLDTLCRILPKPIVTLLRSGLTGREPEATVIPIEWLAETLTTVLTVPGMTTPVQRALQDDASESKEDAPAA